MLKIEASNKTNLHDELPVLKINKTEEEELVETEYLDQEEPENGRAGNHMDKPGKGIQLPNLRELLKAHASYCK